LFSFSPPLSSEDVTNLIGWNPFVHASRYRAASLSLDWEESNPHSATTEGEYCLVEAHALPFHLQQIFADHFGLFEIVTIPLRLLELMIDALHVWSEQREAGKDGGLDFGCYLVEVIYEEERRKWKGGTKEEAACLKEMAAVLHVWQQLLECDICVLPSVLLMDKRHTANEWSEENTSTR
jgi:hypothetical protein